MGLDSVELLVACERFFTVQIPDSEATKLTTVQELTDCIVKHLNIANHDIGLKKAVLEKLRSTISERITLDGLIAEYLNATAKEQWSALENSTDLDFPKPATNLGKSFLSRALPSNWYKPLYKWHETSVADFIDVICAKNHLKLIDSNQIKNSYEVYVCVIAVMADTLGLDFYDIKPHSRFVNDLGID